MASFEDLRKEMRSKYGTSTKASGDNKQKSNVATQSNGTKTVGQNKTGSFEDLRNQMQFKYGNDNTVDGKYISAFVTESKRFLDSAESDYSKMGYGNATSIYDSRKKTADSLNKSRLAIMQYLDDNKDSLNKEYVKSVKDYLSNFDKASAQSMYSFSKNKNYFSQWETEADYNSYLDLQKTRKEQSKLDINAGQKEIDVLESELSKLREEKNVNAADRNSRPYAAGQQTAPNPDSYKTGYGIVNDRPDAAGLQVQRVNPPVDNRIRELE